MIEIGLRLRRQRIAAPIHALLVPGASSAQLLETLCQLDLARGELWYYPVPVRAAALHGILVSLPGGWSPRALPPRIEALTRYGRRLYLPVHGRLAPPLSEAECDELCGPRVHLLHPVFGCVGFDADEAFTISSLLRASPPRESDWSRAVTGCARPPRLREVVVLLPAAAHVIGEEARGDIGSEELPRKVQKLLDRARSVAKPRRARGPSRNVLLRALARGLLGITGRIPETATEPTFWNRIEHWAWRILGEGEGEGGVHGARSRAAARARYGDDVLLWLLKALAEDPERGLRRAIPLHGETLRGQDRITTELGDVDPEFRLVRLSIGASGTILGSDEVYARLHARYRELARVELDRGNARRAAYILAELLGDMRAAAKALEDGGAYLDAAALYRDRCGDKAAAAHCLERGGLLEEALALYRELPAHRDAGRLLRQLGQEAEARIAFERQVDIDLAAAHTIAAAEVVEGELGEPARAMTLLRRAWDRDSDPEACLRRWFEVAARHGAGGAAREFCDRVRSGQERRRPVSLARVMAHAAGHFGDERVCRSAADACRVVVGEALLADGLDQFGRRELLASFHDLPGADEQLRRDTQRHLALASAAAPSRHRGPAPERRFGLLLLDSERLLGIGSARDGLLVLVRTAVGVELRSLIGVALRTEAAWEGTEQTGPGYRVLPVGRVRHEVLLVPRPGARRLPQQRRPAGRVVGSPASLPDALRCATSSERRDVLRVRLTTRSPGRSALDLVSASAAGREVFRVETEIPADLQHELVVVGGVFTLLSAGTSIVTCSGMHQIAIWETRLPSPARRLVALRHGVRHGPSGDFTVASLDEGCALLGDVTGDGSIALFAAGHTAPIVVALRNGRFLVISGLGIDVYSLVDGFPHRDRRLDLPGNIEVLDALDAPGPAEFHLVARRAGVETEVVRYRLPSSRSTS